MTSRGVRSANELLRRRASSRHACATNAPRPATRPGLINQMLQEPARPRFAHRDARRTSAATPTRSTAESLESLTGGWARCCPRRAAQEIVSQTQNRLQTSTRATALTDRGCRARVRTAPPVGRSVDRSADPGGQSARARHGVRGGARRPSAMAALDRVARRRQLKRPERRARPQRRRCRVAIARRRDQQVTAADRLGGALRRREEFVVLLAATPIDEGEQALTRLQRLALGGPVHARAQDGVRHLLGRGHGIPRGRDARAGPRARRRRVVWKPSGRERTAPASLETAHAPPGIRVPKNKKGSSIAPCRPCCAPATFGQRCGRLITSSAPGTLCPDRPPIPGRSESDQTCYGRGVGLDGGAVGFGHRLLRHVRLVTDSWPDGIAPALLAAAASLLTAARSCRSRPASSAWPGGRGISPFGIVPPCWRRRHFDFGAGRRRGGGLG